ncbi:MAG: CHAT domain-containing protein [Micropruina sp.]|uniref:CHAT domain-containing protein n=1 Tax=Micropruina sp. TaxID=2737536 RepID=UPI0039E5D0CC
MAAPDYLDFDLEVEPTATPGNYQVSVLSSPSGEASATMVFPFNPDALENVILKLGRTRSGVRAIGSPSQLLAKQFGGTLYDALFAGEVGICFRRSLDAAASAGKGLRVRLRLGDVPQLADVPWEYLYPTGLKQFLVLSTKTPVVRYLELPRPVPPITVTPPLQVLVVVASPTNLATLDVNAEVQRIRAALAGLEQSGQLSITVVPNGTLAELRRVLRRGGFHVLHFIGHGGFNDSTGEGMLAFEDDNRLAHLVSGSDLATMIHDHDTLRLVLLNACEGARQSPADPLGGVAQSLVVQGVPAVVAMQFEITDAAATVFSAEFYAAIADGYPIDAALAEARVAVFSDDNDVEWGTPVLYLRASDGRIFDVAGHPQPVSPPVLSPPVSPPPVAEPAVPPPSRSGPKWALLAVVAAVLAVAVFFAWRSFFPGGTPGAVGSPSPGPSLSPSSSGSPTPGRSTASLPPVRAVPALQALRGKVKIDGDSGDWQWQLVSRAEHQIAGTSTATADIYLMWDDQALYLLAVVEDSDPRAPDPKQPGRVFRGDSVILELGPDKSKLGAADLARPTDAYYMFGVPAGAETQPLRGILGPNARRNSFDLARDASALEAAMAPTSTGYLLEARIPWSTTRLNGIRAGTVLAANVQVSERQSGGYGNLGMRSTNPQRTADVRARPAYWQALELRA